MNVTIKLEAAKTVSNLLMNTEGEVYDVVNDVSFVSLKDAIGTAIEGVVAVAVVDRKDPDRNIEMGLSCAGQPIANLLTDRETGKCTITLLEGWANYQWDLVLDIARGARV
ncbi:hypothetical protein D3C78_1573240 [compost metagenome]